MSLLSRVSCVLFIGIFAGAMPGCSAMDKPAWLATKKANDAEAQFYAEVEYEGRVYVIGKSATLAAFQVTKELPYRQTFIGAGPNGETVVIEAEAKELGLQARLRRAYEEKHDVEL